LWQCGIFELLQQCSIFELLWQCGIFELLWQCGIFELLWQCGMLELLWQCGIFELLWQCGILELLWQFGIFVLFFILLFILPLFFNKNTGILPIYIIYILARVNIIQNIGTNCVTDRRTDRQTDGQTDRQTDLTKTICLPTKVGGDIIQNIGTLLFNTKLSLVHLHSSNMAKNMPSKYRIIIMDL
jgi:hypothetical protein